MSGEVVVADETARERLVSAAISAFAAKGFHGTATRDIANSAGLSPAGVYVHYASKEELLFSITREGHLGVLAELRTASARADDPVGRLVSIVRAFALWHAERHTRARIANYELAALTPEHYAVINGIRRQITSELEGVVEAGQLDGSFDVADVRMTTSSLLSLGIDVSRWYRDSGHISPQQIADHHVHLALRIVGARPRARSGSVPLPQTQDQEGRRLPGEPGVVAADRLGRDRPGQVALKLVAVQEHDRAAGSSLP
jgi:AcrR family transcriptional regulator